MNRLSYSRNSVRTSADGVFLLVVWCFVFFADCRLLTTQRSVP